MLIAIGFYGFLAQRHFLRQILSFNVAGSGVFLLFGALSARAPEHASDPVPQAMIITGIVVALSATALALALLRRLRDGARSLPDAGDEDG
ncbi:NADH-ubiquinone oxidoreductase, chain 4L (plasmid) [Sinorhizobium sojae CCBAU 05684]|uniref:NADH-ubiquinone oxidoreductase, chain 4L n=1 Tax=Sinorhizobium sojae CCBAU 05684 TaxID=716928 RepID=A0A249PJB3_9HYPH|nr:NADH-quinone oxidoreductase subunit K [Sinorhizobium sojae]ASY66023.1 NADH-ubiquinone oxidoreductase, chain 4L [Sinorhizobium sojae CCBAU 05684]